MPSRWFNRDRGAPDPADERATDTPPPCRGGVRREVLQRACDMIAASGSERHGMSVVEVCTWVQQVVAGSQGETIAAVLKAEEVSGEVLFS